MGRKKSFIEMEGRGEGRGARGKDKCFAEAQS